MFSLRLSPRSAHRYERHAERHRPRGMVAPAPPTQYSLGMFWVARTGHRPLRTTGFVALLAFLASLAGGGATLAARRAGAAEDPLASLPERDVIYYFPDTVGRDPAQIVVLFQAWIDAVATPEVGVRGKVVYFSRLKDLESYMEECRRTGAYPIFGALHAETALEKRAEWGLDAFAYALGAEGKARHSIAVIVRQDSPIRRLEDLRNQVVVAPDYWGRNVRRFEKLVLDDRVSLAKLKSLELSPSSISAIMGVQYRSADAAFASSRVFNLMRQNSSAVWRAMRIVHQSRDVPISAVVAFSTTTPRQLAYMRREGARMHETAEGRKWLEYVRLDRIVPGRWENLFDPEDLRAP
ncbi:MAG: PhnD/SsuA/transferrin family substrate-binding protein [Candidatus Schekmanbacteria bacterium]|nr:PhnD/SsuA/transferrin family substrate-binding protein [Candidatus Schekmanbacteria bacterium]